MKENWNRDVGEIVMRMTCSTVNGNGNDFTGMQWRF